MTHEAGKGDKQRPGEGYRDKYDLIDWPSRRNQAGGSADRSEENSSAQDVEHHSPRGGKGE